MSSVQFRRVSSSTVREVIARGALPELEHGLLKKHGERLRWSTADKALFCNMTIDVLEAQQAHMRLEVHVRSFCHSAKATADFLTIDERFNTKRCILVVGDVGMVPAPWAGLIQPALYLHHHGYNVISIEIPELSTSTPRWLKYGPAILRETLKFLSINDVCTLTCGNGGAVFFEAIAQSRPSFGPMHFVYNIDCPKGTRKAPFPVSKLEEHLRGANLQFWFGFNDEEDVYIRYEEGTPRKSFEAVTGMQARLEGERHRGHRSLDYDEVLITDQLNGNKPSSKIRHVSRLAISRNALVIFSDELLASLAEFFEHPPSQRQADLEDQGGLVVDMKMLGQMKPGEVLPELPAMRTLRLGPDKVAEEAALALVDTACARIYQRRVPRKSLKQQGEQEKGGSGTPSRRLSTSSSVPSLLAAPGTSAGPGASSPLLALVENARARTSSLSRPPSKGRVVPSEGYVRDRQALFDSTGAEDE